MKSLLTTSFRSGIAALYTVLLCTSLLLIDGIGSVRAAFVSVENFESLALGSVDGQNGWVDGGGSGQVSWDPMGGYNRVLQVDTESGVLHREAVVAQDTFRMMFLRFRFEEHSRYSFGLSSLNLPSEYDDFGPEMGMAAATELDPSNEFRVANGNTTGIYDVLDTLVPNIWYNTWVLVDNLNDAYSVWLNSVQGGDADPVADKLDNDAGQTLFAFRSAVNADLVNFFIKTGGGASPVPGQFYIDDIYLETTDAMNLSNPAVVPIPSAAFLLLSGVIALATARRIVASGHHTPNKR